jgi:hypothetical protein
MKMVFRRQVIKRNITLISKWYNWYMIVDTGVPCQNRPAATGPAGGI